MRITRVLLAAIASFLPGCHALNPFGSDPEPNYKDIVAQHMRESFKATVSTYRIALSRPEAMMTFLGGVWRVCLQVGLQDPQTGEDAGFELYAIMIRDGKVVASGRAVPDDRCDGEIYEPMRF